MFYCKSEMLYSEINQGLLGMQHRTITFHFLTTKHVNILLPSIPASDVLDAPLFYFSNRCNYLLFCWMALIYRSVMRWRRNTFSTCHLLVHCIIEIMGCSTMGASKQLQLQMGCKHWWKCLLQVTVFTAARKFLTQAR